MTLECWCQLWPNSSNYSLIPPYPHRNLASAARIFRKREKLVDLNDTQQSLNPKFFPETPENSPSASFPSFHSTRGNFSKHGTAATVYISPLQYYSLHSLKISIHQKSASLPDFRSQVKLYKKPGTYSMSTYMG